MGFFSSLCDGCKHPALSGAATNKINDWMRQVVAIMPGGQIYIGEYDGYGRVGSAEDAVGWDSTVWHKACWIVAGSPTSYTGASDHAPDQGYFFNDPEHDMPEPKPGQAAPEQRAETKPFQVTVADESGTVVYSGWVAFEPGPANVVTGRRAILAASEFVADALDLPESAQEARDA